MSRRTRCTREWREYERTNTAVLSAYVQPIADAYLSGIRDAMVEGGFKGQLYVMQSNCGVDSLEATRRIPITMVRSGPASGLRGAAGTRADHRRAQYPRARYRRHHGKVLADRERAGEDQDGLPGCGHARLSSGYPVMVPVVDLVEIGNGGGSIAWVDEFKRLHVGPQSAGAVPGPAAYGKGGSAATTTDANLALGRIRIPTISSAAR